MNRDILKRYLAQAEEHVRLGWSHIERQRRIIQELESKGLDSSVAREILTQFAEIQTLHIADRDRLVGEMSAASGDSD